jgi:hypothetical protein
LFAVAVRDLHSLFGLQPPVPPRSRRHGHVRIRFELQRLAPRATLSPGRVVQFLAVAATIIGFGLVIGGGRHLPPGLEHALPAILLTSGLIGFAASYPLTCSIFLACRPIRSGQIATGELAPSE